MLRTCDRRTLELASVVFIAGSVALTAISGPPQSGTGRLGGTVVDGVTGRPVPRAQVEVTGRTARAAVNEASTTGSFELTVAAGDFGLQASSPGYHRGYLGQLGPLDARASMLRFQLRDGVAESSLRIRLWPEAALVGRVTETDGRPAIGARVFVLTPEFTSAGVRWLPAKPPVTADDRGTFRIERLVPGDALVGAVRVASGGVLESTTYYPGVSNPGLAQVWQLSGGENRLDLTLAEHDHPAIVEGLVSGADRSVEGEKVSLVAVDVEDRVGPFGQKIAALDATGRFRFARVPPGSYRVSFVAQPRSETTPFAVGGDFRGFVAGYFGLRPPGFPEIPALPDGETWVADQRLDLAPKEAVKVDLVARPGGRVSGRVKFGSGAPVPAPADLRRTAVVVRPLDGGTRGAGADPMVSPQGRVEGDGTFRSLGLPDGDYAVGVFSPSGALKGWVVDAMTQAGRPVPGVVSVSGSAAAQVDISMSARPSGIVGQITRTTERFRGAYVIAFPRDVGERTPYLPPPSGRRIVLAVPDAGGAFEIAVPPGEYLIALQVSDLDWNWMAPENLRKLEGQAAIAHVLPGSQVRISLDLR